MEQHKAAEGDEGTTCWGEKLPLPCRGRVVALDLPCQEVWEGCR